MLITMYCSLSLSGSEADMSPVSDQQWPQAKAVRDIQERGSSGEVTEVTWQLGRSDCSSPALPLPTHRRPMATTT